MALIAVDFDGCICTNAWPEIGKLRPGCYRVLKRLAGEGHTLVLWTCREGKDLLAATHFCLTHGLSFADYNANPHELADLYGRDPRKLGADVFIDDRNLAWYGAEFDWAVVEAELEDAGLLPREVTLTEQAGTGETEPSLQESPQWPNIKGHLESFGTDTEKPIKRIDIRLLKEERYPYGWWLGAPSGAIDTRNYGITVTYCDGSVFEAGKQVLTDIPDKAVECGLIN